MNTLFEFPKYCLHGALPNFIVRGIWATSLALALLLVNTHLSLTQDQASLRTGEAPCPNHLYLPLVQNADENQLPVDMAVPSQPTGPIQRVERDFDKGNCAELTISEDWPHNGNTADMNASALLSVLDSGLSAQGSQSFQ